MVVARRFGKFVLTLALTFYPLPQERKSAAQVFIFSADHPINPVACISKDAANVSPSPPTGVGGEGRGEVARDIIYVVAGCMVAGRKVWPDTRTGAKGQRPTHGRAGTGLASPAGIGAGACLIVAARRDDNSPAIYGWVIVQPIQPSPGRDGRKPGIDGSFCRPLTGLWTFPKREPSHKWLGYSQTHTIPHACGTWWLTARSGRAQGPGQKANSHRLAGPGPDWPARPELGGCKRDWPTAWSNARSLTA
jgi:hypothetical protein